MIKDDVLSNCHLIKEIHSGLRGKVDSFDIVVSACNEVLQGEAPLDLHVGDHYR